MESNILQSPYVSSIAGRTKEKIMTVPLLLLFLYLLVEYGRPQFLAPIMPGLLLQVMLLASLLPYGARVYSVLSEKYFRLYLLLLLFMTLHVFIAINNYYALMGLKGMFSYLLIGVSFCIFIDNISKLNAFLSVFVTVLAVCALNRIFDTNLFGVSGHGVFTDENDFALAMNVGLPIAFFLGRVQKNWKKWLFWLAGVILILGTMISASRGGFVGLVAVATVCWLSSKHRVRAIPVLILLAMLAWSFAPPLSKQKIQGLGLNSAEKDTGKDRVELWKVGWKIFAHNSLIGVGQGNIPVVMNAYRFDRNGESFWARDMWGRVTHSVYLTLLPELGLVGALIFVLMLKALHVKKKKIYQLCASAVAKEDAATIKNLATGLLVSLFGFLVTGIFLSVLYYPPLWNISALLITLFLISAKTFGEQSQGIASALPVSILSGCANAKNDESR